MQWYAFYWMKNPKHLKNIFISAIHQNAGKTTLALGLFKNFQERKIISRPGDDHAANRGRIDEFARLP